MDATVMVHWAGEPKAVCETHAHNLKEWATIWDIPFVFSPAPAGIPCQKCKNEAKKMEESQTYGR